MRSCLHAPTFAVGMSLATCLMTARADVMPEAEYDSQEVPGGGVDRKGVADPLA